MSEANYHAGPSSSAALPWQVRRSGGKRATMLFPTQGHAWREAKRLAKRRKLIAYLHDATGRITARVDYS